jgi:ATP-dependent DNA ligase
MAPTIAKFPPAGPGWLHEVKFDGWRTQLHVYGDSYALYTKNGADYTKRLSQIAYIANSVPAKNAIF